MSTFQVKRLRPTAVLPTRGSRDAAGFDLSASEPAKVPPGGKAIVKTGLSVALPEGTYARIAPRSGLAAKHMINCGAGVVDFDYRGEVGVVLFNHGAEALEVAAGDRVAQLILEKVSMVGCEEVETLESTARGAGGFGSTGVSAEVALAQQPEEAVGESRQGAAMQAQRLRPSAALPVRGSEHAAGFDLAAAEGVVVKSGGKAIVKTGLSVAVPSGTYARLAPRSGLAAKSMIHVGAGVVDYDYRGEVGVVLFNHGHEDFEVVAGDRVAQLVLEEISMVDCTEVEVLDSTTRGAGGFGSTGVATQPTAKVTPEKRVTTADGQEETPEKRARIEGTTALGKVATDCPGDKHEVVELRQEVAALRAKLAVLAGPAKPRSAASAVLLREMARRASAGVREHLPEARPRSAAGAERLRELARRASA